MVIDGIGTPAAPYDLAIDGAKIAGFYKPSETDASLVLDASGMIVCPGFIDIHSHSEIHLLNNPLAESKVRQGVTTELVGNCGTSPGPIIGAARELLWDYSHALDVNLDWASLDEYLLRLSNARPSVNVATLVGASMLRASVLGNDDRAPSVDELTRMQELLSEAMLQGAWGLSSGLIYAPGCYASTQELVDLASTTASFGGIYASHIRGEGRTLVKAVEEAIRIGREARIRVEISHHKACGKSMWGTVSKTIAMMEEARKSGVDVAFDVYPYSASNTSLDTIMPPWAREGGKARTLQRLKDPTTRSKIAEQVVTGAENVEDVVKDTGWENIVLVGFRKQQNKPFEGKSVLEISKSLGKSPVDVALDLIVDEELQLGAIFHEMVEDDVITVMSHPLASIGSDGEAMAPYGVTGESAVHPRAYGTFPRVLRRYVFEKRALSLEDAIRKMTAWPADRLRIRDRGVLAKRMAADVVVFDPMIVRDTATFERSHSYAAGIKYVIVNGAVTVSNGEHTMERAGLVLRHPPGVA
ncbi:MAG: hypothetical protein A3K60_04965 [Euryarchaeota archaeon RBG_19FT_COMBO_56_21]|nr:MAG: hypothetical protein A3K60_04965 [Euryarchaeota archaeon RBG_19FT_COMBO_56_21]